jgi:hypothetical protein
LTIALSITGGARTDRGVAVGDSAAEVVRHYPRAAAINSRANDPLQIFALTVSSNGRKRLWFELDHKGGHVISIEVPGIQACE